MVNTDQFYILSVDFFNVNVQIFVHVLLNLIFSFVMDNPILHLKKAVMDDKQIITNLKKRLNCF